MAAFVGVLRGRRPALRVQLALLYSAVFIGLLVVLFAASSVLFGTANVFFGHAQQAAPRAGRPVPVHPSPGPTFSPWPLLIALALVAVGVLVAWWLAGRILRPLRTMTAAAQEISVTNLSRRLALAGPEDELTELGRTLDDLFGRLQASFESQRQFIANASHELRTPLTGQRTLLQVALADPGADAGALRQICEEVLELSGQQEQLIDSLLTLAVSESGVERWEPVDLAELASQAIEGRRDQAGRRSVRIETDLQAAAASGELSLVESLIANLLDNAIRHNVTGGTVEVRTVATPDGARLSIANTGLPIPAAELGRLFRPFQRLGAQRAAPGDGHGLGLAIVDAIATAHGAELLARPRERGGLEVEVSFRAA